MAQVTSLIEPIEALANEKLQSELKKLDVVALAKEKEDDDKEERHEG